MGERILSDMAKGLLHLIYPDLCAGCGTDLVGTKELICLECMESLPLTNFHLYQNNPVEKIFAGRLPVRAASAYVYFTKQSAMQHILHQIKYKNNKELGYYFGRKMGMALRQSAFYDDVNALVPLPLYFKREKRRGYNQAKLICEGMAEVMSIPVMDQVVQRKSASETQTSKNRKERWENINGKFLLTGAEAIAQKYILLVDDVVTTGATLEACGIELLKAPHLDLGIVTLAYTSS